MTITIGSWIIPLLLTIAGFIFIQFIGREAPTGFSSIGDGIVESFIFLLWIIFSLTVWLVWSLL